MFRHNIPLGRILGIPIGLDYSWFVVFALLTWMLVDHHHQQDAIFLTGVPDMKATLPHA